MPKNQMIKLRLLACLCVAVVSGCTEKKESEFTTYSMIQAARRILPVRPGADGAVEQEIAFGTEVQTVVSTARAYDLRKRYWSGLQRAGLAERVAAPYLGTQTYTPELGFAIFDQRMDVQPERLTLLVRFSFTHQDPEVARLVADQLAQEYLAYEKEAEAQEEQPIRSRLISHAFPPQK